MCFLLGSFISTDEDGSNAGDDSLIESAYLGVIVLNLLSNIYAIENKFMFSYAL